MKTPLHELLRGARFGSCDSVKASPSVQNLCRLEGAWLFSPIRENWRIIPKVFSTVKGAPNRMPRAIRRNGQAVICPFCSHPDQRVLDSRVARDGQAIRRRRECINCERRFTTFEVYERPRLFVVKRDGTRQEFAPDKLLNSMLLACGKRPVPVERLREAVANLERGLYEEFDDEVASTEIGERVMRILREIDTVAYVRFASVYQEFDSVSDFSTILKRCR